jgi:hypothetical protein
MADHFIHNFFIIIEKNKLLPLVFLWLSNKLLFCTFRYAILLKGSVRAHSSSENYGRCIETLFVLVIALVE